MLISRFTKNSGALEDWPSWHNCAGYGRIYMTGEFSEHSVDAEDGQHEHSNGIFVVTTVFGNPVIGVATDYHGDVDEYPIMLAVAEDTKNDLLYWYDDLQDFEQVEAVFKRMVSYKTVSSNSSKDDGAVDMLSNNEFFYFVIPQHITINPCIQLYRTTATLYCVLSMVKILLILIIFFHNVILY